MKNNFIIDVGGDPKYKDLTAEIYCGENPKTDFFAMINQDSGFENMEIEIFPKFDGTPWVFNLVELKQALEKARQRLTDLRRTQ